MQRSLRDRLIERIRTVIERRGFPRLQMMLLVALTGGAGFLCSFSLLRFGLDEMWLRYLIAISAAYLVFLALLWAWLRSRAEDFGDAADLFDGGADLIDLVPGRALRSAQWQGGGGASGSYEESVESASAEVTEAPGALKYAADAAGAGEELAIPIFIIVFVVGLLASIFLVSFSIVYSAPVLFAELLLDGVLAATLYRRLKKFETRHWFDTAVRRTFKSFLLAAALLTLAGWAMSIYAPEARSLGEVLGRAAGAS